MRIASLCLHIHVIWTATAFRRNPIDDLVRIRDITGFAVDTIGSVNLKTILPLLEDHLVNRRRAEVLARIALLLAAASVTTVWLKDYEVAWLVFLVPRA
jgi:hypothetical protein